MIPQQEPQLLICRTKRKTCRKLWIILGLPVQPQWESSLSTLTIQVYSHRSKLLHWIFNPFLLSRLLLKRNIVYQQKWSYFLSAGRSLFGGADPNAPNYSVIDTDYTSYSVVYMCRPIAGIFKKGAKAKSCLTHFLHLSFLNQNPFGSLQEMRCPLTQQWTQLWSKLTEKSKKDGALNLSNNQGDEN